MAEKKSKSAYSEWSPLLRRVVLDEVRWPSREAVQALGDGDVDVLREVATRRRPAPEIRQDKVLAVLADRAPDAETTKVLKQVLDDRKRSGILRVVAAIELGRMPPKPAQRALLAHVDDERDQVAHRVIQSLGRIGTRKALEKLQSMDAPASPHVRRQWAFSQRLIRHRLGRRGDAPTIVRGTVWDTAGAAGARPLRLDRIAPQRLQASIAGLRAELLGVELAEDRGFGVSVDGSRQQVLLARRLTTRKGIEDLLETPTVAGVVAMWEQRTGKPVLEQVVLTEPHGEGVLVQGFRLDGTLTLEGFGTVRGGKGTFTLVNADGAGRCRFRISGELSARELVARGELVPRSTPRATREPSVAGD